MVAAEVFHPIPEEKPLLSPPLVPNLSDAYSRIAHWPVDSHSFPDAVFLETEEARDFPHRRRPFFNTVQLLAQESKVDDPVSPQLKGLRYSCSRCSVYQR